MFAITPVMSVFWLSFIAVGLIICAGLLKLAARFLCYRVSWRSSFLFAAIALASITFDHLLVFHQPVAIRIGHAVTLLVALLIFGSWFFRERGINRNGKFLGWSDGMRLIALAFAMIFVVAIAIVIPSHVFLGKNISPPRVAVLSGLATSPKFQPLHASDTPNAPDAFYDLPSNISQQPGTLLRSEPLKDLALPDGVQGWRILYATSVDDNTPATAVAIVFAPIDSSGGARPVVAWEHATTGLLQKCMPSLLSWSSKGIPERNRIVRAGWVVVATDYSFAEKGGPHPYLIGEGEARAALDSVRAARQMRELTLDKRTAVWGYSQGGHAALWAGIIGPRYAPDLEICGVAAIAPAANIEKILAMNVEVDKRFGPYLALSYSRFYPDIKFEQAIRPEAIETARQIVNLCDFLPPEDHERFMALAATFEGPVLTTSSNEALRSRIEQNTPGGPIQAPVVIAQGLSDIVVPPSATDAYVEERCATGQRLEYWTFAGRDHITIMEPGTPLEEPLIKWTTARFANEPQASGCVRKSF
jgi:pimeloyl-ACP methyl ester carboxylesterase